jgi:hypothetical protein
MAIAGSVNMSTIIPTIRVLTNENIIVDAVEDSIEM